MSLRHFGQTLLLLGFGVTHAFAGESTGITSSKSSLTAPPRAERTEREVSPVKPSQDQLISEILGVASIPASNEPNTLATEGSVVTCVALKRQDEGGEGQTPPRQQPRGMIGGRIIGVNMKTATVAVEFSGRLRPKVDSQFSVHHDYAFSSQHLGRLQIVYLAGNSRAIARAVGRTNLARLGKGDRIAGRIVSDSGSPSGAMQMANHKTSAKAPSCSTPAADAMPNPPSEPAAPYVPEETSPSDVPAPSAVDSTQTEGKLKTFVTKLVRAAENAPRELMAAPHESRKPPTTALSAATSKQQQLSTAAKAQIHNAQATTLSSAKEPPPAVLLFEDE